MQPIRVVLIVWTMLMAGCGSIATINNYQPSSANIAAVKAAPFAAIAVGEFTLAPDAEPNTDKGIMLGGGGGGFGSPVGDSFAQFLRQAIVTELTAADKFAPDSEIVLQGQLVRNQGVRGLAISGASAAIAAQFQVRRNGELLFDKRLSADAVWKSSFAPDIALVEAKGQYLNLYGRLLAKLFADPEFHSACAPADVG